MKTALRTIESSLSSSTQAIDLTPQQSQMLVLAQEHADNELAQTDTTTTELFHTIGEEMQNRLVGLLKQIETLQTALVQSQGQNQELHLTQNAQIAALEARIAAQQVEITTLQAQNARLQADSDKRVAAATQAKTDAVATLRQTMDAHVNSLTEQNQQLKTQADQLQGQLNIWSSKRDNIKNSLGLLAKRADHDSKIEYHAWASAHLFQVLQNELGQIRNSCEDLLKLIGN